MSLPERNSLPIFLPATANVLIVRPDRLGDVVLSTPVFEVIRRSYPKAKITVLAQPRVAPALRGLASVDSVIEFSPESRHAGWSGFWKLVDELRQGQFHLALVLQAPSRVAWALLAARIPIRLGPLSKWYSFITYNRGVRQRRSQVDMHEADYNLQLLQPLEIFVGSKTVPTQVAISEEAQREVDAFLRQRGVLDDKRLWIAVHPGMGGSALNWPEASYLELVESLLREGRGVLVTGGPGEQAILDRFQGRFGSEHPGAFHVYGGATAPDVQRLAAVFRRMRLVIAPSTGPLHVAVAVGVPVVSFYPPIRVQSARRW
ncbi:glycosyltransferase family 9 protein, partial [bacterium]|nr:glycosyltransferase family 9 protein [bacterium]